MPSKNVPQIRAFLRIFCRWGMSRTLLKAILGHLRSTSIFGTFFEGIFWTFLGDGHFWDISAGHFWDILFAQGCLGHFRRHFWDIFFVLTFLGHFRRHFWDMFFVRTFLGHFRRHFLDILGRHFWDTVWTIYFCEIKPLLCGTVELQHKHPRMLSLSQVRE